MCYAASERLAWQSLLVRLAAAMLCTLVLIDLVLLLRFLILIVMIVYILSHA